VLYKETEWEDRRSLYDDDDANIDVDFATLHPTDNTVSTGI
jgi:hypothetical protein